MVLINLSTGRSEDVDVENGLVDTVGEGEGGRRGWKVALTYIHYCE